MAIGTHGLNHHSGVKCRLAFYALALALACASSPLAHAQLVINPIFDSSITSGSNGNAAEIEATIEQAISNVDSQILTPITVNIDFTSMSSGLGQSDTYYNFLSYSQYLADLEANPNKSANDVTALASLAANPNSPNNPVNNNSQVQLSLPLLRAIGESALGSNASTPGNIDSTISLNFGLTNISRTGPQNPSNYDLQAVAAHEIDEVLGIGGEGSALGQGTTGPIGALDLFRYSAPGVRSYTQSSSATSYFSINGGVTNLVGFNQAGGGSDYGDWATGATPQVQDAFGTPGVDINIGTNELTALDVEGYTLIPEPRTYILLLGGMAALLGFKRRRLRSAV